MREGRGGKRDEDEDRAATGGGTRRKSSAVVERRRRTPQIASSGLGETGQSRHSTPRWRTGHRMARGANGGGVAFAFAILVLGSVADREGSR